MSTSRPAAADPTAARLALAGAEGALADASVRVVEARLTLAALLAELHAARPHGNEVRERRLALAVEEARSAVYAEEWLRDSWRREHAAALAALAPR